MKLRSKSSTVATLRLTLNLHEVSSRSIVSRIKSAHVRRNELSWGWNWIPNRTKSYMHIWITKKHFHRVRIIRNMGNSSFDCQGIQTQLLKGQALLSFTYLSSTFFCPCYSGLTLQMLSVGIRKPTLWLILVWGFLEPSLAFLFPTRHDSGSSHVKLSPPVTSLSLTADLASLAIV